MSDIVSRGDVGAVDVTDLPPNEFPSHAIGAPGFFWRWTVTAGEFRTEADIDAYVAQHAPVPLWVVSEWREIVAHIGQPCHCLHGVYGISPDTACALVLFDDDWLIWAYVRDVRFD